MHPPGAASAAQRGSDWGGGKSAPQTSCVNEPLLSFYHVSKIYRQSAILNFQYQWLTQYTAALLGDVFEYHLFRKQIAENLKHTWPAKPFHMGPRTAPAAVAPPSSPPPPHCLSNREEDRTPPTEPVASLCSRSTPSGLCIQ